MNLKLLLIEIKNKLNRMYYEFLWITNKNFKKNWI